MTSVLLSDKTLHYTNKSLHGISDTPRYALAGYYIFVVLSSSLGDTVILIASIKYNALRLHCFIVAVIQHIAVSDLLVTLTYVLPKVIAKAADGWLLGVELCFLTAYSTYYFSLVSLLFICILVTSKLLLVKSPRHRRSLSATSAHVLCGGVWSMSLTVPAMFFIVDRSDVSFDFRTNVCSYHFSSHRWKLLKPLQALVFMIVPNCIVVMTTVALLVYLVKARRLSGKVGGDRRWQGIILSILTATVYCVSVIPYAVYRIAESSISHPFFHNDFLRLSGVCLSFNTISNFYIYSLTVPSFRRFLKLLFLQCSPSSYMCSRNLSFTPGELD